MGTHPIFESDFDLSNRMLSILQEAFDWLNAYMARWWYVDFHGQQRAERIFQVILVICGIIGFVYGYSTESMQNSMIVLGGGLGVSSLITVLPWKFLRPQEKDLKWHDECEEDDDRLFPSWYKRE